MRHARLLLPVLLALATAACASRTPAFYVTDSATGQPIATARQSASPRARGLLSSGSPRANGAYAYAAPQSAASSGGRGLFNSDLFSSDLFSARARVPVYNYRPQAQPPQTYSYRPPQQAYAQQAYHPPQPQPAGYYAERYGWY